MDQLTDDIRRLLRLAPEEQGPPSSSSARPSNAGSLSSSECVRHEFLDFDTLRRWIAAHPSKTSQYVCVTEEVNTPEQPNPETVGYDARTTVVILWISNHPIEAADYKCAFENPVWSPSNCHDLLAWLVNDARNILLKLSDLKKTYRQYGVRYHNIPHSFRHGSSTNPNTIRVNSVVLRRIAVVFECQGNRAAADIFDDRHKAASEVQTVLDKVKQAEVETDVTRLRSLMEQVETSIQRASDHATDALKILTTLGRMLEFVEDKATVLGPVDLGNRFGVEGSLYRAWIATFPEVESGAIDGEELAKWMPQG